LILHDDIYVTEAALTVDVSRMVDEQEKARFNEPSPISKRLAWRLLKLDGDGRVPSCTWSQEPVAFLTVLGPTRL
jgi:hypothetical protein